MYAIYFPVNAKKKLNMYTRILDIIKLEQIHFMVVKK
jgi:hypothetical protein